MKALIIKEQWLDKIINNNKTLEIRNNNTNVLNEQIYLLESRTNIIRAIAKINNTIKINKNNWEVLKSQHQVNISYNELKNIYNNPFGWNIQLIKIINNITYKPPQGCIIWVNNVPNINVLEQDIYDVYDF